MSGTTRSIHALIPARGGSKSVPRKNLYDVAGFPLVAYSIAAAMGSRCADTTVVTTDSPEIAQVAAQHGAKVPFLRPPEFADDSATDMAYIGHYLGWLRETGAELPKLLLLLRPTTPLRDPTVILDAVGTFIHRTGATSLRSVHKLAEPPQKQLALEDGWLTGLFPQDPRPEYYNLPRQAFPQSYQPNGYVDVVSVDFVLSQGALYGDRAIGYETAPVIEIDHPEDMERLEYWLDRHGHPLLDEMRSQRGIVIQGRRLATG